MGLRRPSEGKGALGCPLLPGEGGATRRVREVTARVLAFFGSIISASKCQCKTACMMEIGFGHGVCERPIGQALSRVLDDGRERHPQVRSLSQFMQRLEVDDGLQAHMTGALAHGNLRWASNLNDGHPLR